MMSIDRSDRRRRGWRRRLDVVACPPVGRDRSCGFGVAWRDRTFVWRELWALTARDSNVGPDRMLGRSESSLSADANKLQPTA